ncbi:MAG: DNA-binding response regulator [Verrucomicrobiales bacterium]|nr:DNA-binding response regulator [Verrucomicrobiales bacterium]|tara:strand:- start:228 stop:914 length:687 start_codon:yes stop_codon:yes gene_type:complete
MPKHVLVVEDEPDTAELIELHLKNDGYRVTVAGDGDQALKKVHKHMPDLVILDLMIPEITGVEVCKFIRKDPATQSIPIIMCTAKTGEIDKILGLELGADDYVTKPFSPRELLLRVKNLIKRSDSSNVKADERLVIGEIVIDKNTHEVKVDGQTIDLTATEYKLLILFTEKIGRVLSREVLLRDIWGYKNDIETRTVDMHVQRLRNKLLSSKNSIFTVRGFGYKFIAE